MATLKLNTKSIKTTIARQTAKKMALELRLKPKLKKFLRNINKEIANKFEATETIPDFEKYKPELIGILKEHYRLTQKRFMGKFEIKASDADKATDILMTEFIDEQAPKQAGYILDTTQKDTYKSLASVMGALVGGGIFSSKDIAKELKKDMDGKVAGRASNIALTETQSIAEKTKFTEAMVNAGELTVGNIPQAEKKIAIKTWHTVGDISVRPTHSAADMQTKNINEPFVVGGSLLMYPSDTSLGADMVEIYNCRCISLTNIES